MIFERLNSPATKCNIHGVSGSIPREGEAQRAKVPSALCGRGAQVLPLTI